ncbi:MAG: hypothetical protein AAGC65_03230 [Mucilaginibacter sp.]|uniref:hypothetical protein n=1 Tax=Mucilaginibacter sp. TaxID=1882438 RepID=UPI0031A8511D
MSVLAYSQCIDRGKIKYGGNYYSTDYIRLCPTYAFATNGDTSKNWNVLTDPIDIKQAPAKALAYKRNVDIAILKYSGDKFYSKLNFHSLEVVYPQRLNWFKKQGRQDVTLKYYKAKYFFFYQFKPDSIASFLIGIAVNKEGKIISPFVFPSKKNYAPIDTSFTYCKLLEIARSKQRDIDPVQELSLEFDTKSQRFLWLISQSVVDTKEGDNFFNQVMIDAADLSKVQTAKTYATIVR